jgi:hypothetical protein
MIVGKLILKLGIEAENLEVLKKFEDDAKKSAKTVDTAAKSTDKLSVSKKKLGFNVRELVKDLQKFRTHAIFASTAATALSIMSGKSAAEFRRFELNTGMSAQKLQEWQQRAAMSGVAADDMQQSIQGLQQAMTEIRMGGGDVSPFARLRIPVGNDPLVVLNTLRDRLKEFPTEVGTAFARRMNLSDNMIAFLREMKDMPEGDKSLLMTDAELKRMKEFDVYFNRVWDAIKRTGMKLGALLSPLAKDFIYTADRFRKAFMDIGNYMTDLFDRFPHLSTQLKLMGIALAAALFPVTTSIAAALFAIDEAMGFMRGDNTYLGMFIGMFVDWENTLKKIYILIPAIISGVISAANVIARMSGAKEFPDIGEAMMDNAIKSGILSGEHDFRFARMEGGNMAMRGRYEPKGGYRDAQAGGPQTTNNTVNISGVSDPNLAAKMAFQELTKLTYGLSGVPEVKAGGISILPQGL